MSMPSPALHVLKANLLRLLLSAVAVVALASGAAPAPAEAGSASAKAHGKRATPVRSAPSSAKRRDAARNVRVVARATGRKVG